MNYQKIYNQLINRAKSENRVKYQGIYYEKHHIVPKCLGGNNDKENLVLLTGREHFLAHWLLHRIDTKHKGLSLAFYRMCHNNNKLVKNKFTPSSRAIEEAKLAANLASRGRIPHNKGKKMSQEFCKKVSESKKGRIPWNKNKKMIKSVWNKNKTGFVRREESNKKASLTFKEKYKNEIHPRKGKASWNKGITGYAGSNKGIKMKIYVCCYCNKKIGGISNFNRWHNENCKYKI